MEDTLQKKVEQENEALIAEMLRNAEKIELPSELKTNPVIHKGDAVLEAPMVVKEISSAGYVWVWDSRTFEKMPILYYMLPSRLRERRPDGSFRFTTVDPGKEPQRGTIKCRLHSDSPDRAHYNELGFRVCKKDNITNPYQLRQHMLKKHPQEWAAIDEEQKSKEKEEDRALQRLLIAQQLEKLEKGTKEMEETPKTGKPKFICDICNADFGTQVIMEKHKAIHKQENK